MRVVIAEDSVLLREGLIRLLGEQGATDVAAVGDGEHLLRAVEEHLPDVCVVDVRMPPTFLDEGLRAALVIRARWPDVGVLVLSQYVEERYASELIAQNTNGVGYLLKDRVADVAEVHRRAAPGSHRRHRAGPRGRQATPEPQPSHRPTGHAEPAGT